jgi:flagellar biosynthesis protein FliP
MVVLAVSVALSLVAVSPEMKALGGIDAFLSGTGPGRMSEFAAKMAPFLDRHTEPQMLERLRRALATPGGSADAAAVVDPEALRITAFLLSELKAAFELGLILLVPLLVIDLLVVNVFMALGVSQLAHVVVALPLKLLLFFALDGWGLIAAKVLRGYAGG